MQDRPEAYGDAVSIVVEQSRALIEDYIEAAFARNNREWGEADVRDAENWIATRFPWMTPGNRAHGVSQGVYYAWRH
jgi:hypothetical protein